MKIILIAVLSMMGASAFGACKDFSGHYVSADSIHFVIVQTGCEHLEFTLTSSSGVIDTRSFDVVGVFGTSKEDATERVDGLYQFQGDELVYIENHLPKDPKAGGMYTNTGKFHFSDANTLMNDFEMFRNQTRTNLSLSYKRL